MSPNPTGWSVAAALLFLGASLLIAPGNIDKLAQNATTEFLNFAHRVRFWERNPWRAYHQVTAPSISSEAARFAGALMIAIGLLLAAVS